MSILEAIKGLFKQKAGPEESPSIKKLSEELSRMKSSDKAFIQNEESKEPTSIIAIDMEEKIVIVRTPKHGNFPETDEVEVYTYGNSPKKFKTKVLAVRNGYLVLSIPVGIEDAQKRRHYRVDVKKENIKANLIIMGNRLVQTIPVDMSISGARLEIRGELMLARNALVKLCLEIEDEPLLPLNMFVASSSVESPKTTTIRGSFYGVEPEQEKKLGKFLLGVQRNNKRTKLDENNN